MNLRKYYNDDKINLRDQVLSAIVVFYYLGFSCNLFFKLCFEKTAIVEIGNWFYFLWGLVICIFFPLYFRVNAKKFVIFELLFAIFYLYSLFMKNAKPSIVLYYAAWTLLICIPLVFIIVSISDKKYLYDKLKKIAPLLIIICSSNLLINFALGYNEVSDYSLPVSGLNLFPVLILWEELSKKFSWFHLCVSFLGIICCLLWGGRRVLLIIGCYFVFKLLFHLKYTKKTLIILMSFLLVGITGTVVILKYVSQTTQYTSIRIIDKMISGNFFKGDRAVIYQEACKKILEKPMLGWGLCGGWNGIGEYPHNIFLEIWQAFGIIVGTGILVIIMILIMNAIRSKKKNEKSLLIICMALCSQLLISGPILNDIPFWFLLAICISKNTTQELNEYGWKTISVQNKTNMEV